MHLDVTQVSIDNLFGNLVYSIGAFAIILIVLALGFIDAGNVRRKNLLDTWVVKIVGAVIAAAGTIAVGYAFWQWSFYQAFEVPDALAAAIGDWWIGGQFQQTRSLDISSDVLAGADTQQVFVVFFATFSMATIALIHGGVLERVRPRVFFVMAAVIGLALSPLASYLTWGPVGPLTPLGVHDFEGIFPLYIFAGAWVLVMNWRLGPRLGAFAPHPSGSAPRKHNLSLVAVGLLLIMFALPFVALGATWIIPGTGVFGIAYTDTGWGIIVINMLTAFAAGGITGAVLAYWKREPVFAFVGPIAGAVITGTLLDIGTPLQVFVLGLFGAPATYAVAVLAARLRLDDQKIIPLAFGPGVLGAIATGFIAWGTPTGGYPGLAGSYALQSAQITPLGQLAGIAAIIVLAAVPCLIICLVFERFGGLRVTAEVEIAGFDQSYWKTNNFSDEDGANADRSTRTT